MKIKLITDRNDTAIGMRLAGVDTTLVRDADTAQSELDKAKQQDDIGLLLITRNIEKMCHEAVLSIKQVGRPLLIEIPDADSDASSSGAITEYIREAIGIEID